MKLVYNGVEIKILFTNRIDRIAHYSEDGQTYLFTQFYIDVLGVMNPAAMAYTGTPPVAKKGTPPVTTDAVIRHPLLVNRKNLLVEIQSEAGKAGILLEVPGAKGVCDVRGGPFPRRFSIIKMNGMKTGIVNYVIEAFVNECDVNKQKVILSHRWKMTENTDDNFKTGRNISGIATFRQDLLFSANNVNFVDEFRSNFVHPIPQGWKRENIRVVTDSENNTIRYSFDDMMKSYWVSPSLKITSFEGFHTSGVTQNSTLEGSISGLADIGGALAGFDWTKPFEAVSKAIGAGAGRYVSLAPQYYEHVNMKAWGSPETTRRDLIAWCTVAAWTKINPRIITLGGVAMTTSVQRLTRAIHDKFVEYDLMLRVPPISKVHKIPGLPGNPTGPTTLVGDDQDESTEAVEASSGGDGDIMEWTLSKPYIRSGKGSPVAGANQAAGVNRGSGWYVPNRDTARSLNLEVLVQQILESPCAVPPGVPQGNQLGEKKVLGTSPYQEKKFS